MIYEFLDFKLNTKRLDLSGPTGTIQLQPQAFALLLFLVENADRVVTKDEIFEVVWQGRIVSDSTLNARINAIRKALGDDGSRQAIIKTLPRRGFRFSANLKHQSNLENELDAQPSPPKSIGIIPFTDIGNDPEQSFFADGLTEDLITDLSKVEDLFVIAKNTTFSYKGSSKGTVEIGREMGVAHVLEGSVRRSGDRIRINAQLVTTDSGGLIWAERYDRDLSDIFAVQDNITLEITTALRSNLQIEKGTNRGASAETYELCLRARSLFFKFQPDAFTECLSLLERAVKRDPEYSRAWAEQVFPHQCGHTFGFPGFEDGLKIAIGKGQKAVELDQASSFAHARFAFALTMNSQHDEALEHFNRALDLEPNNAEVLAWFCEALNFAGLPQQAVDAAETCLQFDPVAPPNVLHHLAHAKYLLGDLDGAIELEQRVERVTPTFPPSRIVAAAALTETGRLEEAKEQISTLQVYYPNLTLLHFRKHYPYKDQLQFERMISSLAVAGLR